MNSAAPPYRYPLVLRWIHWLSLLLIVVAYVTSESAEELEEASAGTMNWHVLAGLGLLLLFLPRVLVRLWMPSPPVPASRVEAWMARTVQLALLLFMVVQPMLGICTVWAEGQPVTVPLTGWNLVPALPLQGWGEAFEELHELVGNAFYGVIGIHALASAWHQFVRHDGVLRRML